MDLLYGVNILKNPVFQVKIAATDTIRGQHIFLKGFWKREAYQICPLLMHDTVLHIGDPDACPSYILAVADYLSLLSSEAYRMISMICPEACRPPVLSMKAATYTTCHLCVRLFDNTSQDTCKTPVPCSYASHSCRHSRVWMQHSTYGQ